MEMCQQHVQLAEKSGWSQTPVIGCLLAVWGEVLAEVDDLNGALERAKTGVDLAEQGSDVAMGGTLAGSLPSWFSYARPIARKPRLTP
jgi:hypothetical protein